MANSPHRVCSAGLGTGTRCAGQGNARTYIRFLTWIATLIMWSIYKDKPGYEVVKRAAARAFNVSITISIATIVGMIIPLFW